MVVGANRAMTSVHVDDPDSIRMTAFPVCEAGPFVAVRIEPAAALLVSEVAVLDALLERVGEARQVLIEMLAERAAVPQVSSPSNVEATR